MAEAASLTVDPWTLTFSERIVETRFRDNFLLNRMKEDVQWALIMCLPIVVFWLKVAVDVCRMSIALTVFLIIISFNWVAPAIVYYHFGREAYAKYRTTIVTSARYLRVVIMFLCAAYMRPGRVLQAFFADLIFAPILVPWTFRLQFRHFVVQHGCLFLAAAYAYANPTGLCAVLCTTNDADQYLQGLRKIGDLMSILQGAFGPPPTVVRFGNLQYCQCIAVFWTGVAGFIMPAMISYVVEFRSRKAFASCHGESPLEGGKAATVSQILIGALPMVLLGAWQITILWIELALPLQ